MILNYEGDRKIHIRRVSTGMLLTTSRWGMAQWSEYYEWLKYQQGVFSEHQVTGYIRRIFHEDENLILQIGTHTVSLAR